MPIFSLLQEIFVEKSGVEVPSFLSKDLTKHYQEELGELALDKIFVATSYRDIEKALARYKYFSEREYVDIFVELLSKVVEKNKALITENTILIPIPMHWSRYFSRGFDHTGYIVDRLSQKVGIPSFSPLAARWAPHQSKLSREKRLENKKNRFTIRNHVLIPDTIILFDDVISTGATANECAKILKAHGAKTVIGIFLASNI